MFQKVGFADHHRLIDGGTDLVLEPSLNPILDKQGRKDGNQDGGRDRDHTDDNGQTAGASSDDGEETVYAFDLSERIPLPPDHLEGATLDARESAA